MTPTPGPVPGPVGQVASAASEVQEAETSTYLMTPRNSMTVTHTKGLLNMPGQNNCFLNSAVQVLWHLDIFRRSFRDLTGHACMAESCIFCALKELFTQFQYSQESALPPDALRHALAKTFCDQRRFQLGFMDDAAECFENILLRIHVHIANQESEDMCGDVNCIPHQKFAMTLVEQPMCHTCGATSEPLPFTQMVHYVTTSALCSKALEIQKQGNGCYSQDSFGKLLRLAGDVGDVRDCTSGCGSKTHIKKTLMNHPAIVSIGLVWDSECPSLEHITDVFHNIGMTLQLKDMFHSVVDTDWVTSTSHELVGVVTYYGKHYSTFFFHTKLRVWIYFDDATVREIGPRWEQVVEKCQRGHFQPLLLLFANSNGASVPANSVPQDQPLKEEIDRRDSTSVKSTNQRQAVISKYLMFQNMCKNDENGNLRNQSFVTTNQYAPKIYSGDDNSPCHIQQSPHDTHQITVKSQVPVITNSCVHPHNHSLYTYNNCIAGHLHPHSAYCVHHCQNSDYNNVHPASNCTNAHVSKYSPSSHNYQFHVDPQELSKVNGGILSNLLASKYASLGNQHQQDIHQPVNSDFQCISNTAKPQEQIVAKKESLESSKDSDSAFAEDDSEAQDTYISRKAVENVLNLQKLQRQISLNRSYNHSTVGNRNSSSSLESFDNTHHKLSTLHRDLHSLETENLSCRRDSGSWSGDRNSSSSSSNASVESPFLSVVAAKRLLLGPNNFHLPAGKGHLAEYSNVSASDHGYDSYSVSSSDSYPSVTGSPAKLDPRLTQIPEDWQEDLDKKLQMITVESSGPPDCDKLCAEADLLLAKSHDKEREGDLVMAALLCDSAAARARAAMDAPYNNSRSLVSAKMKHSTCVMRSSCLYRRIKDNEENERRRQKGIIGGHSRQSSRDSNHGRHSRQGSKDSTHAKQTSKENSRQTVEEPDNFGKNIEIYGTLPKKGSRKKIASSGSVKVKDDQIYKDFLDKQRQNVKLPSGSNDHSQKVSVKSQNKHESPKSKFESISEKQKKPVVENSVPKSPIQKKQDNQPFLNNEDLETNNAKKWTSSKQLNFDRSCHGLSPPKDVDYISGGEAINRDLLSPLSPHDKKQHRVKRKLMGGFMKRKNRSLPDLREEQNLSDPMDRSFDDTVIQMPSTLTLPNGKLKKLDFQSDAHIHPVTRGFHQPHYAFVKKDLTHRPLLMKVNPPNIQPSVLSSPKSKPTHILPSLPKKIVETKTKSNEITFTRDRPSKIPFMSPVQKADVSVPPVLSPLKPVDSAQPTMLSPLNPMDSAQPTVLLPLNPVNSTQSTVLSPQKTSTPVLNSQMTVLGPNTEMGNVASVLSPSNPNEDLPLPSNPFLAELQAKRQQIIGTMSQKEKYHKTERENLNLSSELKPNVAKLSVASDGSSWLQELQSKQQQMLHKQNCQSRPLLPLAKDHRDFSLSPTENSCAETFTRVKPKVNCPRIFSQNLKTENEEASSSSLETKLTESSSACSKNTVIASCDNSKARSVKDLASRFEKVFNSHQDINCSSESLKVSTPKAIEKIHSESVLSLKPCGSSPPVRTFSSNMSIDHDLQEKIHLVQYSENKSLENHTSESLSLAHSTHSFSENQKSFKSDSDSQSDSQIIRTSDGSENIAKTDTFTTVLAEVSNLSTQQRPQKPPDYETALQRLELIRTNPATSSAELYQRISDSDCISSSLKDTSAISVLAEPPRKKQGPKKTVTFSDEVVLVSCADYDDSDFLPNPLLERVYQQHIQAGGSEITQLNISSDCTAFKTDSEYSCSDEKKAEAHHTGSHEESQNNNSYGIIPCHLCHNKYITPPSIYCPDCAFYMSRFQP